MGGVKGREITRNQIGMYVRGVAVVSIDIDIDIECCVFALFALFALFVLLFSTVPTRCATLQANC